MFHHFSLHKISNTSQIGFDAADYSKFKFGDPNVTSNFGADLAKSFLNSYKDLLLSHSDVVFLPSPFNYIPTASYFLSQKFKKTVNSFLFHQHRRALLESKIHRYKTYSEDYGSLSFEERIKLISSDTYHIDTKFLTNRLCIFLDDIKITGSHELIIRNILKQNNVEGEFIFVYFAELTNPEITPVFENYLNYYHVKSNKEVSALLNLPDIQLNTRTIKFILNENNPINSFILELPNHTIERIINYAIGNNYHLMNEYKLNLEKIIKHINYGN
ncbi:MAG TPA: phosphoribosyltransferase family protein [Bacteroidia bacterium]|jgi:hypothetical protein|nr:phosphoribosyltransferase family protein [Bacteroidia bacterium]